MFSSKVIEKSLKSLSELIGSPDIIAYFLTIDIFRDVFKMISFFCQYGTRPTISNLEVSLDSI